MGFYETQLVLSTDRIKQNDTFPALVLTFLDNTSGSMEPVDLTTSTAIEVILVGTKNGNQTPITATCTVLEAVNGTATFAQTQSNVATPDAYTVEGHVTWPGGAQTFPNSAEENPTLTIDPQLAPPV